MVVGVKCLLLLFRTSRYFGRPEVKRPTIHSSDLVVFIFRPRHSVILSRVHRTEFVLIFLSEGNTEISGGLESPNYYFVRTYTHDFNG